ncbi:NUDIX domain-containing protein [Candidatus Pacebacteria bacterium]|nr:NUDIX domain-containing protein [Candidatus Paceibacterota bacterium]
METKQDISYGVIPYIEVAGVLQFFLIHQLGSLRGDSYWIFPKGHVEGDETPKETALRELKEETGLLVTHLDSEHPFTIAYDFTYNETKVEKEVTYFLGKVSSGEYILQEEEVKEAGWYTYEEAYKKITYENSKKLLDEVNGYLHNSE